MVNVWLREKNTEVLDQSNLDLDTELDSELDSDLDADLDADLDTPGRAVGGSSTAKATDPNASRAHDPNDGGKLTSGRSGRTHPGPCPDQNRPDRNQSRASGVSQIPGGDR